MVAPVTKSVSGRAPICAGRTWLDAADDALADGDAMRCAAYLREAVRRFLEAHCEQEGVDLPTGWRSPLSLYEAYNAAGHKCCCAVAEIIETTEGILACKQSADSLSGCVSLTFDLFGNDFKRNGGAQ